MSLKYRLTKRPSNLDDLTKELRKSGLSEAQIVFENRWISTFDPGGSKIREAIIKAGDRVLLKVGDFDFSTVPNVVARVMDYNLHNRDLEEKVVDAGMKLSDQGFSVTISGQNITEFATQRFPEKFNNPTSKER